VVSETPATYTAFAGETLIATGALQTVLTALKQRPARGDGDLVLIFDDQSGRQVDFDLRGTLEEALARAVPSPQRAGPGRPKLGIVSREVTLLPRHWEWLEQQPNGASAALRRLVDEARNRDPEKQKCRLAIDATYRFMSAMAGNLPGFEEANRALYTGNGARFENLIADWPADICTHLRRISQAAFGEEPTRVVR
jgi:hypothetical protein